MRTEEELIFRILMRHLSQVPGGRPIVYPGEVYPEAGKIPAPEWIIVSHTPNVPEVVVIDPTDEVLHRGVLGLGLMTSLTGAQAGAMGAAGELAGYWQGLTLREAPVVLRVVGRPHVAGGYRDQGRWRTPVIVQYESIATQ